MKTLSLSLLLLIICTSMFSQFYTTSGGEVIFQSAMVQQNGDDLNTNIRFTTALHIGEFVHADIGNHIGFFSGIGLRNVGFITNEKDIHIKYRSYNLGIPLAFKAGSMKKNLYFFGGAEYEYMLHFKQKTFRDGGKYKYGSWFSNRTPDFIPSVFAGFQFPDGIQLKFKYYLDDFLNNQFKGKDIFNDYTGFTKTRIWYISVSYIIRNQKKAEKTTPSGEFVQL